MNGIFYWAIVLVGVAWYLLPSVRAQLYDVIKIGALIDTDQEELEQALKQTVEQINRDSTILPRVRLATSIKRINLFDSFHARKSVCSLLEEGVAAVLGPSSISASALVHSASDSLHFPHIQTSWDMWTSRHNNSISVYPHPQSLSKAYLDLISAMDWKTYTIVYENNENLLMQEDLLRSLDSEGVKVNLQQLRPGQTYKKLLKDIAGKGETNIILDIPVDKLFGVLKDAQDVGMMTEYHNYFILNLDLHTVNLGYFQYGRTNITGLRLVDPMRFEGTDFIQEEKSAHYRRMGHKHEVVKTQVALFRDAVYLLSHALHKMSDLQLKPTKIPCSNPKSSTFGRSLINHLKTIHIRGMTGNVKVDSWGQRTEFNLDVVELKRDGFTKVGIWNWNAGVRFTKDYSAVYQEVLDSLKNRTLKISTILNPPYSMLKASEDKLMGNDKFEGFCIDLMHEISKLFGFRYEIRLVRDNSYGFKNERGEWNGMIRELIDREVDLAVGDLTITYQREEDIDFTMPFMNLGISILFKKPTKKVPKLFSFLAPMSLEVWSYMATAYLGVSLLLFILARFSPSEWVSPHPCNKTPNILQNHFSFMNSLWFTLGSFMQQGTDINPRAFSTRILAGVWGFFTLIMVSSYTANLAAFLTVERMKSPIESADDLAKQSTIRYGCVSSGSTRTFFKESKIPNYRKMWSVMEATRPSVFVESSSDGVDRVLEGDYAFLMESTSVEYVTERNCDLMQIGGLLDSKGFGIATPSGSPYRMPLSSAILKLQEDGILHELKERWWRQKGGVKCNKDDKLISSANELNLAKVGGVFVILMAGLGLACVLAIVEFVCKTKSMSQEKREESTGLR